MIGKFPATNSCENCSNSTSRNATIALPSAFGVPSEISSVKAWLRGSIPSAPKSKGAKSARRDLMQAISSPARGTSGGAFNTEVMLLASIQLQIRNVKYALRRGNSSEWDCAHHGIRSTGLLHDHRTSIGEYINSIFAKSSWSSHIAHDVLKKHAHFLAQPYHLL